MYQTSTSTQVKLKLTRLYPSVNWVCAVFDAAQDCDSSEVGLAAVMKAYIETKLNQQPGPSEGTCPDKRGVSENIFQVPTLKINSMASSKESSTIAEPHKIVRNFEFAILNKGTFLDNV